MFKVSSGIFALFALLEIGVAEKSQVELNLANTILRSTSSIQYDPLKSAECFSAYLPKLNNLTAVYEEDYQLCLKNSEDSKEALRNELEPAVSVVNSTRDEICQGFAECVFDSDPYGYFECSNDAASKAISKAYSIQTLSQDRMQYITLKYETIQYAQNVCTSKASETYVRDSTKVHAELQDCLAGKVPEESSTSTTESTSTSADSTLNTEPF